ncbi:hypothetical protein [Pedobacter sp. UBA5917]|jgi:predicted P-loop ATPase/GTPase|uniref:hypothetical protein n=1 Tax=Pedobacter sp. UBA5917 TaxID=1947061 RepID=UPI0025E36951|nr:hypothetical protein [Pedobacter sp. UBA5917]
MISKKVQEYIQQMLSNELNDPDGSKEAEVVQILRVTNEREEIAQICEAIAKGGSWFSLPVLYARFKDHAQSTSGLLISNTILALRDRQSWSEEFKEIFFSPHFWKIHWKTGHGKFLSFVSIVSSIADSHMQEHIGEAIIREINYDTSPYENFKEMKLLEKNWDPGSDLNEVLSNTTSTRAVDAMLEELNLPKDLETTTDKTFNSLRNDYLITRLGVAHDFPFQLTLFDQAIKLNEYHRE